MHHKFKNYIKTALGNLARNKVYSFINIVGLSLGLACAMLFMLYAKDEVSFDRFHKNVNNIYRVVSQRKENKIPVTSLLQGPRFRQNVPGIRSFVRIDKRYADIKNTFAILAIIISCLGLFGLSAYTATQRIKEIGVRKVLGASVINITSMLSKDFLKLVLIAAIFSSPLAWLVMNRWLESFAYRINISVWVFVVAGLAAVFIALITVSWQAKKQPWPTLLHRCKQNESVDGQP